MVGLNANEHVDDVEDAYRRRVGSVEGLTADFAKVALDRVETVTDEVV